jgi:hypothetical protein
MIQLRDLKALNRQRLSGLLGLALDGSRLDGVVLRRTNGSLQVQQSFSVLLSLDPLTADAELVGREIRNHLDAAGVRERRCVLGLPLKWALATQVELPELPEADVASFLQIEAERGFASDVATLLVASSRRRSPGGKQHALLVGVPRNHSRRIEQALRAAKLRPLSFSLGLAALQPAEAQASNGVLALAVGESHVGLQITCGGGVAALRTLEGVLETEGGRRLLHSDIVAREARITLGQLPAEMRETVRHIRIFGPRDLTQQLADEMELRLEPMGLRVEAVTRYAANELGLQIPADTAVSPALSLAARRLADRPTPFEFLPPKVTAWQQVATRYSSRKLRAVGAAAALLLLIVGAMFGFQQWQLMRLGSQWNVMAVRVKELEKVTEQIHQFRPWYDESARALVILRQLTQAFPETGVVTAKTVEIRELNAVTCTGVARDNQELAKTMDRLSATAGISEFHRGPIRGKSPIQFTFDYRWSEGGKREN